MKQLPKSLLKKLYDRQQVNGLRTLVTHKKTIDFFSNDYLGLANNKQVQNLTKKILKHYNLTSSGATGSRLLSGNHALYPVVEQFIASFHNVPKALLFNSGYNANVGFFSCVPQRGDIVFYDELIHASIRDGLAICNAKTYKFKHNDLEDLKEKVEKFELKHEGAIYVVTESVFSMDGDSPDLKSMALFCGVKNIYFVVDEAHAFGVFGEKGRGMVNKLGIEHLVFAQIVTYGKALGCHGAAILGSENLYDYLVNFARSFIYTTGLPPHAVANIGAAYTHINKFKIRTNPVTELRKNINYFNAEVNRLGLSDVFIRSDSAIHCCIVPGNEKVKILSVILGDKEYDVKPILSPTVPKGSERLRICLHDFNTTHDISKVLKIIVGSRV